MFDIEKEAENRVRGMAFCGYRTELAQHQAIAAAIDIMSEGVKRAYEDDLRADERFQEALRYLESRTAESSLITQIQRALDIPRPEERRFTIEHLSRLLAKRHAAPAYFDLPGQN